MTQIHWVTDFSGDFNVASNWSSNTVPGRNDDAILDAPGATPYTVATSVSEEVNSLQLATTATLVVSGGDFYVFSAVTNAGTITVGGGAQFDPFGTQNAGTISVSGGGHLGLLGVVDNTGTILLNGSSADTVLEIDSSITTFSGGGNVILSDSASNKIMGFRGSGHGGHPLVWTNVDNTISGAGRIGGGALTLINDAAGVIDANGAIALILNTQKHTIANAGLIEATGAGGGIISSPIKNTGTLEADGGNLTVNGAVTGNGSAVIRGGTLKLTSSFNQNVNFAGKNGKLELAQSQSYSGAVSGFSLTGKTVLDLADIAFVGSGEATFSGTTASGTLTVTDGTYTAHITLIGDYTASTFVASDDGKGGVSIIDPAKAKADAALAHRFVAAMAGLGGAAGGAIPSDHTAPVHQPMLSKPRAMIA